MRTPAAGALLGLVLLVPLQDPSGSPPAAAASARAALVPAEVAAWLASSAHPLASLDAGGQADLSALRAIVGDARILAIGEATHGSHEFFAFKARAFEFLAAELGFTDFAMETGFSGALATNAWVEHGRGTLESALAGLANLWRTEEYRGLLAWMRAWNADPAHARKVRIHGLDMQIHAGEAAGAVRAYLERVDPEVAEGVAPILERIGNLSLVDAADLDGIRGLFDELREPFVAKSSAAEWASARQHFVVLLQRYRSTQQRGNDTLAFRDACMAENARWILRQHPDARLVISAHNGHVSKAGLFEVEGYGTVESIGHALAQAARTAKDEKLSLVVLGAAFGRGGFYAYPASGGGMTVFRIEAPNPASHEALLLSVLSRPALLDLRNAPEAAARAWLDERRPHVGPGGVWDPAWLTDAGQVKLTTLPAEYDALFFVPEMTPAKLLTPPR